MSRVILTDRRTGAHSARMSREQLWPLVNIDGAVSISERWPWGHVSPGTPGTLRRFATRYALVAFAGYAPQWLPIAALCAIGGAQ